MQIPTEPQTIYDRGWVIRIQPPVEPGSNRVLLLLHGWKGNENVMWVFTRSLPKNYWLIAPRAPVQAPDGEGYGWAMVNPGEFQPYEEYQKIAPGLLGSVDAWLKERGVLPGRINVMGFSQGAAMCYSLLAGFPDRVDRAAALAGFLPRGAEQVLTPGKLVGKQVFVSHGTRDETIPVALARQAVETLEYAGANVTYCEDDSTHKLGASCHKGLSAFFA